MAAIRSRFMSVKPPNPPTPSQYHRLVERGTSIRDAIDWSCRGHAIGWRMTALLSPWIRARCFALSPADDPIPHSGMLGRS